jgi:hypothetical protein
MSRVCTLHADMCTADDLMQVAGGASCTLTLRSSIPRRVIVSSGTGSMGTGTSGGSMEARVAHGISYGRRH